jgi:predicted TIM-barrel fold metal-dependent hydrolase
MEGACRLPPCCIKKSKVFWTPEAICYNPNVIIDAHVHIFSPRIVSHREEYIRRDPVFAQLYNNPRAKLATVQELLVNMEQFEIEVAVVASIGWVSHELCRENNEYLLECLARYPKRIIGLAAIQPRAGVQALRELEHCIQNGVKGVGELRPDMQGFDLCEGALLDEIIAVLVSKKLVWLSHASEPVGHIYPGKGNLTPEVLYPFVERYPALQIIFAHWGGGLPFYALMPEVKAALSNVCFDTAASPYLYCPAVFRHAVDAVGETSILFGSDFPVMSPGKVIREIHSAGLSSSARSAILGGNAQRVFNICMDG